MYIPTEELQEVRIFKSRIVRITEHKLTCPEHLRKEIVSVVRETISLKEKRKSIFEVDRSILPMVAYLARPEINFERESFIDKQNFEVEELERLVQLLE